MTEKTEEDVLQDIKAADEASRARPEEAGSRSGCCYLTLPSGKRECFDNHSPESCRYMGQQANMPHQWAPGSCPYA